MANSPANTNRLYDGGIQFLLGVNSNLHPSALSPNQYSWAVNTVNKGGILDTRPDYNSLYRLPDGKAQGFTTFTPTGGNINHVSAVNGRIYVSEYPFTTYSVLPNIQFSPTVDHIVFKEATQAADKGVLIQPRSLLIMQDGISKAAYWDGTINRHLNPGGANNETIIGLWMEWVGFRLWVSRGREFFASDIFDPLHFIENQYLVIGGSLNAMDGDIITGMSRTADSRNLLVWTIHNTTVVQAGITDRTTWKSTPNFISLLFPGVGCSSGISPFFQNGELWWWSVEGARRFTAVGATLANSRNSVSSIEMKRSFDNLSTSVQHKVCGFSYGSFLGFSIPSGDVFNRHTWALDTSTNSQLSSEAPFAWQGVWMGTRPVQWSTANIMGKDRAFYLSQDVCGIRVWEAFDGNTGKDNGGRIFCSIEFGGKTFDSATAFKKFLYTEYHLSFVRGEVDITSEYRGDWGCWKLNATVHLCATDCFENLICNSSNPTIMNQNRYFKTEEARHECQTKEGTYSEEILTFVQNRIRWYGKNAVRIFKSSANQFQERSVGECAKSDLECRLLACCDQEVSYVSHLNDTGYGSGSSTNLTCSI